MLLMVAQCIYCMTTIKSGSIYWESRNLPNWDQSSQNLVCVHNILDVIIHTDADGHSNGSILINSK